MVIRREDGVKQPTLKDIITKSLGKAREALKSNHYIGVFKALESYVGGYPEKEELEAEKLLKEAEDSYRKEISQTAKSEQQKYQLLFPLELAKAVVYVNRIGNRRGKNDQDFYKAFFVETAEKQIADAKYYSKMAQIDCAVPISDLERRLRLIKLSLNHRRKSKAF